MTEQPTIKACFCGRTPTIREPDPDLDGFAIHITCRCGIQMFGARHHFSSVQAAAEAWNHRANPRIADTRLLSALNAYHQQSCQSLSDYELTHVQHMVRALTAFNEDGM